MANPPVVNALLRDDMAGMTLHYEHWPAFRQRQLQNPHKQRGERFSLFQFLWSHGMRPEQAAGYVLFHGGYDQNARADVRGLVAKAWSNGGRGDETLNRGGGVFSWEQLPGGLDYDGLDMGMMHLRRLWPGGGACYFNDIKYKPSMFIITYI